MIKDFSIENENEDLGGINTDLRLCMILQLS